MWSKRFRALLSSLATDATLGDARFPARNFLLDDRIPAGRETSYEAGVNPTGGFEWFDQHNAYLDSRIRRLDVRSGASPVVRTEDAADTFSVDPLFSPHSGADPGLELVRVVRAQALADLAVIPVSDLLAIRRDPLRLQALLDEASDALDQRPVFASFWEDAIDAFMDGVTLRGDWADRARDRLGLAHLQPIRSRAIPVFALRYPIRDVTRLEGMRSKRPLAIPLVVDCELFEAFCPAPAGQVVGQLIDLSASLDLEPAGEILHPPMRFDVKHVFEFGEVRTRSGPLADARTAHLMWLRELTGTSYGDSTDSDLL